MHFKLCFVLCAFLALTAVSSFSQAPAGGLPDIDFPEVEGWRRGTKASIPGDNGYTVAYDSEKSGHITVYVYTRGNAPLGPELKGVIKDEFDGARNAIKAVADAGIYTDFKELKNAVATVNGEKGKTKALWAMLSFSARGNKLNSEIFLLPFRGQVVKIRASRPASVEGPDAAYSKLMAALDELFSK